MNLDSWSTAKPGDLESGTIFGRPPFQSRQFLAVTMLVVALCAGDVVALIRLFDKVPLITLLTVALLMFEVIGNWVRAMVIHKKLHSVYADAASNSSLELTLRAASSMSYWGVAVPAVVGMTALLALLQVMLWTK